MTPGHNYRQHTPAEVREEREERAAIRQYLGGMSRADAERAADADTGVAGGQLDLMPAETPRRTRR